MNPRRPDAAQATSEGTPLPAHGVGRDRAGKWPSCGSRSLRKAIDAKCRECLYDECVGQNWRKQTHACEITKCPLWPVRPKSRGLA